MGNFLNVTKNIYKTQTTNIILKKGKEAKSFPAKVRNKARMSPFTLFSTKLRTGECSMTREGNKRYSDYEEEILSLFTDDMTVFVGNLKELKKKPLETKK